MARRRPCRHAGSSVRLSRKCSFIARVMNRRAARDHRRSIYEASARDALGTVFPSSNTTPLKPFSAEPRYTGSFTLEAGLAGVSRVQHIYAIATMDTKGHELTFVAEEIGRAAGLNAVSRVILSNAAHAVAGMVAHRTQDRADRPLVGMTMFGVTTPCVTAARQALEARGYDCLVFHATGTGGRAMEELVRGGV